MSNARVEEIVRAVLYEGYMLYPYRSTALKNRQRWNFGVLFPESYASGHAEASSMQVECLVVGAPETAIVLEARFLQLCEAAETPGRAPTTMDRHYTVERQATLPEAELGRLTGSSCVSFKLDAGSNSLGLPDHAPQPLPGSPFILGEIAVSATRLTERGYKLTARVRNVTPLKDAAALSRDQALTRALISAHLLLHVTGGEFLSSIDPPDDYREASAECRNVGAWPVLAGEDGQHDCMLVSPIILYDYPQLAPESAGDFFDGTEIDELLTLRILTLTDKEKQQMRGGDPRARAILERSEALPLEQLMKLHGATRGLKR